MDMDTYYDYLLAGVVVWPMKLVRRFHLGKETTDPQF